MNKNRLTILQILEHHEWSWKEGNKVYCQTCGIEHRDTTKVLTHRKGCEYLLTVKKLASEYPELGFREDGALVIS